MVIVTELKVGDFTICSLCKKTVQIVEEHGQLAVERHDSTKEGHEDASCLGSHSSVNLKEETAISD